MKKEDFKVIYTEEEINELLAWIEAHRAEIPASLQVDEATFIPDLHLTLSHFSAVARQHRTNLTFKGQIAQLFRMKERLVEELGCEG